MKCENKADYRQRRHYRVRNKVQGTQARPRMAVFKSGKHMYVQFIDDDAARTVAAVSTAGKNSPIKGSHVTVDSARQVGEAAAAAAKTAGIETVVFDRGGFKYTGKIKVMADAAREAGLKF